MPGNLIKWKIIGPPDRIDYKHKHPFDEEKDIFPLIIETESALKEKNLNLKMVAAQCNNMIPQFRGVL